MICVVQPSNYTKVLFKDHDMIFNLKKKIAEITQKISSVYVMNENQSMKPMCVFPQI